MSLVVYIGTEKFSNTTSAYAAETESRAFTLGDIVSEKQQEEADQPTYLLIDSFTDESLHAIEYWLKQDASRKCTIAWPHPAAWLAVSLQQAPRPKEALWQWSYQADLLLRLFKKHRQQLLLQGYVPGSLASDELPLVTTLNLNDIAPLYRLIAMQLVQEDSLLQQALNYLSASSASVQRWQSPAVELAEQALGYASSEESNRQLSEQQLEKAQQEIKSQQDETARFKKYSEELTQQLEQAKKEIESAQGESANFQKHIKELTQQLEKEQKASTQAEQNATDLSQRLSEKNAQLLTVEQERDSLKNTLDKEQVETAELQKKQAELRGHTHQIEQENAALLDQLMKVQETFEDKFLENSRQQEDIQEQLVKLNWLRGKTKKQEEKVDQQKALLKEKTQQLAEAEALHNQHNQAFQKDIDQLQQVLAAEQQEKALIVTQLHDAQEQLIKVESNSEHYQKQAESRQKTINVLKQEQQGERHYYESIVQWLRVLGHRNAAAAYRYSRPFKRALSQQLTLIKQSAFFDAVWYSEQYPDVKTAGIEPAEHYLKFGAIEGRNPSDKFDTCFYLTEYPDVAISGQNPLLHYLRYGQHEERLTIKSRPQLSAPMAGQTNTLVAGK